MRWRVWLAAACLGVGSGLAAVPNSDGTQQAFFEQRVRPALVEHCYECHSAQSKKLKGGLRLDSRPGLLKGGETRAAVVPGKANQSLLIEAIRYGNPDLQMPPNGKLPESVLADLTRWVAEGAFFPEDEPAAAGPAVHPETVGAEHWAFQPIRDLLPPPLPAAATGVASNAIDGFIGAKLAERGLGFAPPADRRVLARRATFDLTGLPPTSEAINTFLADIHPDAFERMLERLLASPQYGERWGRWWLDVARYADSNGQDENKVMANAWRYRDWVIRSFNRNQPFDAFITEQIAGDLLPTDGASEPTIFDRWTATGLLVLGPKMLAEQDKPKLVMDLIDEQIDVVSRAFLGLTVSCARCHDHKFDPIPARDYYALAGIFRSTKTMAHLGFVSKFNERRIDSAAERQTLEAHEKAVAAITAVIDEATAKANELGPELAALECETIAELVKVRDALKAAAPPPPAFTLAVEEDRPVDLPVHLRGSHLNLAKTPVPRGFIDAVYRIDPASPAIATNHSGRLELARWLTGSNNPLTARVIVNRIWQAHFGEGLVRTSDNFGVRGERPSHPELLDWLAREFIRSGWDVKQLHRLILTSAAWRQASAPGDGSELARAISVDPDNRLLWRFPRQRLEAEMIRDALLAVSGRLDSRAGGSLVRWKNDEYTPADEVSAPSVRRSVYLPVVRDRVFDMFTIFDFANPSVGVAKRTPTVVSHQALFFLNSPLVKESARAFARDLLVDGPGEDAARVRYAYERALGRPPSSAETERALQFIAAATPKDRADGRLPVWSAWCQVLLAANEFVYRE